MSKAITKKDSLDLSNQKVLAAIRETVAKNATDAEFALFIEWAKATGLNPFKREIWFIKDKENHVQLMTGINGFYAIANSYHEFDGVDTECVEKDGELYKCIARVYRKDRGRPITAEAHWSEYKKDYGKWKTMPRLMLSKCAESLALRKSFPHVLNQIYTEEEIGKNYSAEAATAQVLEKDPPPAILYYRYDIRDIAEEKQLAAQALLAKHEGILGEDNVWSTTSRVVKLDKYEVK